MPKSFAIKKCKPKTLERSMPVLLSTSVARNIITLMISRFFVIGGILRIKRLFLINTGQKYEKNPVNSPKTALIRVF